MCRTWRLSRRRRITSRRLREQRPPHPGPLPPGEGAYSPPRSLSAVTTPVSATQIHPLAARGVSRPKGGRSLALRSSRGAEDQARGRGPLAEPRAGGEARSGAERERRIGCGGGTRTPNLPVNSRVLYQFNYPTRSASIRPQRRCALRDGSGFATGARLGRMRPSTARLIRRSALAPAPRGSSLPSVGRLLAVRADGSAWRNIGAVRAVGRACPPPSASLRAARRI